ncbi:MAG TPA: ABC transporter permease, partial [Woeseiaceae bacterium]|nr:ABC transporter permease [Woeseiaceae bacterium]
MSSTLLTGAGIEGRRAIRGLLRSPGFSVGVILVLGIAIAGTVTVATAAYELFLRPLPFANAGQLVQIAAHSRTMGFDIGFAPPMLAEIREEPVVTDVAAYHEPASFASSQGEDWRAAAVSYNLTDLLGIRAIAGRSLAPSDAETGAPRVALISESVWRNRFGADESVIGRELTLGDRRVRVVGVMPAAFTVPSPATELWYPLRYTPEQLAPEGINQFKGGTLVARVVPGHTAAELRDALRARYLQDSRLKSRHVLELMGLEFKVRELRDAWTAGQREPLAIIGAAALLVLSAALFNVAGLWLSRLLGRSHEQAIQAALGARSLRRLGRTFFEFALLGGVAAGVALALTPFALGWLRVLDALDLSQPLPVHTGPATVVIALLVLAASAVPVLAAAAWQQRRQRRGLIADLSGGGRGAVGSGARTRRVLIAAQVALAMSVLCAMGLLLRSWHALLNEDLGFESRNLLIARVEAGDVEDPGVPDPRVAAALDAVRAIPGVTAVTHANVAPFAMAESISTIPVPGAEDQETTVRTRDVGERYFETVRIPIRKGRSFDSGDTGVIVDEYFADRYFPDGNAVGERLQIAAGSQRVRDAIIIGVAATAKYRSPDEEPNQGSLYQLKARPPAVTTAVIATDLPPATLTDDVRATLERVLGPKRTGNVVS